jgi:hypothetical protein
MKKTFLFLFICVTNFAFAEKIVFPKPSLSVGADLQSVSGKAQSANPQRQSTQDTLFFSNVISEMELEKISVQGQNFTALQLDGYVYHGEIGHPKLPAKTQLLDIPPDADGVEIKIVSSEYVDIELSRKGFKNQLFPVQLPIRKSAKNTPALVRNRTAYRQKSFTSRALVDVENLGIMKNRRLVQLNICPIQYLPSKNVIRVYYFIEFEVNFVGMGARHTSPLQSPTAPKIYQIISDRNFENTLIPFVNWKTQKGFDVRVAYTDQPEVGNTTSSIKNYLQNIYESEDRADYLLLVGDTDEIPAFPTSFPDNHPLIDNKPHVTDLYYAEYTGDFLPDVFYGRLSANTEQQLHNQIEKIIAMEQLAISSTDFLGRSLLIAGHESGSGEYFRTVVNAATNYARDNYFNNFNNINATVFLSPNSSSQVSNILSNINNGAAVVNYTGHGTWNMWQVPNINITHVNALENSDKYPFIIGNCCLTNKFNEPVCFGEALLRAEKKGAVTYIGASSYSWLNEDFQWAVGSVNRGFNPNTVTYDNSGLGVYDRMFHTYGEPYGEWASTAGEIMFFGNMAVQLGNATTNSDMKKYYWEIYHILGDPSYSPYLFKPQPIVCNYSDQITTATNSLVIETVPFAYAGFSMEGQLLSAGRADNSGLLILSLPKQLSQGLAQLVITAPNHAPYQSSITITSIHTPVVVVNDFKLSINSNAVPYPVFAETVDLSIELKNPSSFDASRVSIDLSVDTTFVKIVQPADTCSVVAAFDSIWIADRQLIISPNIPNRYNIRILATITYNDTLSVLHYFNFVAAAPQFAVSNLEVVEGQSSSQLHGGVTLTNYGLATLFDAQVQLVSKTSGLSANNLIPSTATFAPNTSVPFAFTLTKPQSASVFLPYILDLSVQKDAFRYQTWIQSAFGNLIEDFERGYFHDSIWWCDDDYPFEWLIDSLTSYEGRFAMKSAKIDHGEICEMLSQDFDLIGGDSIVFYYKVSSEEFGDGLEFWIWTLNENSYTPEFIDFFSGEIPWTRAAFPVEAGVRYFYWAYAKDETISKGDDRAWVDYIVFPKMNHTPNVPHPVSTARRLPDHIVFDAVVNNGLLQARINAETPAKATVWLTNMLGQAVATVASNAAVNAGQNDFYFNLSNLPKGTYVCTYFDGNRHLSRKFVW